LWDGEGTGFVHADLEHEKLMRSLLRDDSSFLSFEGDSST